MLLVVEVIEEVKKEFPEDNPGRLRFAGVDPDTGIGALFVAQEKNGPWDMSLSLRTDAVASFYFGPVDKMTRASLTRDEAVDWSYSQTRDGCTYVIGTTTDPDGVKTRHYFTRDEGLRPGTKAGLFLRSGSEPRIELTQVINEEPGPKNNA